MPWSGRESFQRIGRWCRQVFPAVVASTVLTACSVPDCPKVATSVYDDYARCLARNESVTGAAQVGDYTVLDIHLSAGFMALGASYDFQRLLHDGRPVVDNSLTIEVWSGRDDPVFFIDPVYSEEPDRGQFQIVYTLAGTPVVEHIGDPNESYHANYAFRFGYPLTPQLRYFGAPDGRDHAGYLLGAHPTRVIDLPPAPGGGQTPLVGWLASVSPDGKAYAYIDGYQEVQAILVVDADGAHRGLIALPATAMEPARKHEHPFEPAWRWFAAQFTWARNDRGDWIVAPHAPASRAPENPLEELFIDAENGYRQCFSDDHPACLRGWRVHEEAARAGGDEECCLSKYAWTPTTPARAFGAGVSTLLYADTGASTSGYQLMLDAPHDTVTAAIIRVLRARRTPFIQPGDCPDSEEGILACVERIEKATGWDVLANDGAGTRILHAAKSHAVFVTPSAAFAVFPMPDGRSAISTLARRAVTAPAADRDSAR